MPQLLRDWKPGKNLAARARRKARVNYHWLKVFKPAPHDLTDENEFTREFPQYWSECRFCGKFVILVFDDKPYHAYGTALTDQCPAAKPSRT